MPPRLSPRVTAPGHAFVQLARRDAHDPRESPVLRTKLPMPRLPIPGATCLALALALALPAFQAQAQMSPEPRSKAMELMKPCRPDVQQYCSSVQRGGGRILELMDEMGPGHFGLE